MADSTLKDLPPAPGPSFKMSFFKILGPLLNS